MLGLDESQFETDRQDPSILKKIESDSKEGRSIGVTGIPTIFMNGKRVKNRNIKSLKDMIEREQKKAADK